MDKGAISYRRYLDGDDEGVAEIVCEYKDGLILYLNGFVGNVYLAEELAEDTFFRLMTKRPRFSGKSSFKSWLYAIGRHIALDRLRKDARRRMEPIEEACALRDETDLEREYLREERKIILRRALDNLPTDYRQVLWLVYFDDLTNSEAATAMNKNERQIRNLLYRAKQSLKTELETEGFTNEE